MSRGEHRDKHSLTRTPTACELLSDCLDSLRVVITDEVDGKKFDGIQLFDIDDVKNTLHLLKFSKAAGIDGLMKESIVLVHNAVAI